MTDTVNFSDTLLSDMHKDAYGFRPRDVYPEVMSREFYEAEVAHLQELICEDMERERQYNLKAQRQLEKTLTTYQERFGISRGDALRWLWEAEGDEDGDVAYWAHNMSIAYDLVPMYRDELKAEGIHAWGSAY